MLIIRNPRRHNALPWIWDKVVRWERIPCWNQICYSKNKIKSFPGRGNYWLKVADTGNILVEKWERKMARQTGRAPRALGQGLLSVSAVLGSYWNSLKGRLYNKDFVLRILYDCCVENGLKVGNYKNRWSSCNLSKLSTWKKMAAQNREVQHDCYV